MLSERTQHPHVDKSGRVCLGNITDVTKYFYTGDWDLAIASILKLLRTYNNSSPYVKIGEYINQNFKGQQSKLKIKLAKIAHITSDGEIEYYDKET